MFWLHSRAEALAAAVTPTDVRLAVWASRIFHTLHILPIALYYTFVVDKACGYDASKMTLIWWSKLAWLGAEWLMFASLFQGIGRGWEPKPRRSERLRAKAA